jgi:hypothetical protein
MADWVNHFLSAFEGMAYIYKLMSQIQQVSYPATSYPLSDVVPQGIHGALQIITGFNHSPSVIYSLLLA